MEKLLKAEKIQKAALIISAALCLPAIVGTVLFSLKLLYVPLVICIAVAVASIYAIPFLWISLKDGRLYAKIISEAAGGAVSLMELSAALGIKPEALRKIIDKGIKKEYVSADRITA